MPLKVLILEIPVYHSVCYKKLLYYEEITLIKMVFNFLKNRNRLKKWLNGNKEPEKYGCIHNFM